MRLFVVRHGQTSWNVAGRAQGHSDIELDDHGLSQAELLAESFAGETAVQHIFSSDLKRARVTAEAIGGAIGVRVQLRPELREICFGVCEGKYDHQIGAMLDELAIQQGIHRDDVAPPGSESNRQVWDRLTPFIEELSAVSGSAIVVGHGGSGALMMAQLVRGTIETRRSFRFGNTGYYEVERRSTGHYSLVRCNVQSHLEVRELSGRQ